jgi:hypothetical protein
LQQFLQFTDFLFQFLVKLHAAHEKAHRAWMPHSKSCGNPFESTDVRLRSKAAGIALRLSPFRNRANSAALVGTVVFSKNGESHLRYDAILELS